MTSRRPIYVIQRHEATHLHYDLRLEMDGVLKSWAVPKEPVNEPNVRRLAIQVEDHPLDYASFEGIIEEGQYGAGKVEIWDSGHYDLIERTGTRIQVEIKGRKLKGKFVLLKFGKPSENSWLFFKKRDAK